LFNNTWKRDGFDNRGSDFIAVNGAVSNNAYWDPSTNATYYDQGLAVVDVIAHEFGHAYTYLIEFFLLAYQAKNIQRWFDICRAIWSFE
jgi:hypothetical protein